MIPNPSSTLSTGNQGEALASAYLTDLGYHVLAANYRHGKQEIDLVALDGNELVIVEVKTRSSRFFGNPEQAVDRQKQRFLIQAASGYLAQHNLTVETRFDVIAVLINENGTEIQHFKEAFAPGL